jgi:ABC-type Fe3+-hydroxamate transport system substrate-binding protein
VGLDYAKESNDLYTLSNPEDYYKYQILKDDLNSVKGLSKESRVCPLTTSTANILYEVGANVVAAPTSATLNQEMIQKQEAKELANIGSPLTPNLEIIESSNCDISFIADSMPHGEAYEGIENLIYLPQTTYQDVFITLYTLNEVIAYDNSAMTLNELITNDLKAKELYKEGTIKSSAVLMYSGQEIYVSSEDGFTSSMLSELGIENQFTDYQNFDVPISYELLLQKDPEYIVVYGHASSESMKNFENNESLSSLTALKNNNIIYLESSSGSADLDAVSHLNQLIEGINEVK